MSPRALLSTKYILSEDTLRSKSRGLLKLIHYPFSDIEFTLN